MRKSIFFATSLLVSILLLFSILTRAEANVLQHTGMCDASASVALGNTLFVVANDEDSILRVYARDQAGQPVYSYDLSTFLQLGPKESESDIEASARLGDLVFWISSHGAKKSGKRQLSQQQLFATTLKVTGEQISITPVGTPYQHLIQDLSALPILKDAISRGAEERNGLNIEGLSATPDGKLLIAFRNPIPDGNALLVPLENPQEVIQGKAAQLGEPILLPLQGLGIRSIDYFDAIGQFLIVAGPYNDTGSFQFYRWDPATSASQVVPEVDLSSLSPEAVTIYPDRKIQLLSDDGTVLIGGRECKNKKVQIQKKSFRSLWIDS